MVADHLGVESRARAAGEEAVLGILGEQFGRGGRGATVGGARHDVTDEALHVPALFAEVHREPVEEFGVAGRLALRAEVAAGLHESKSEELLPEAVDRHAGGQGIGRREQPVGEVASVVGLLLGQRVEGRGHAAGHRFAGLVILPAGHHVRLTRLGQVGHDERRGDHVVEGLLAGFLGELRGAESVEHLLASLELVLEPPVEQALALGVGPLRGLLAADQVLEVTGKFGHAGALFLFGPELEGPLDVLGLFDAMADREAVPIDRAVELRESEAVDLHAGFQAELRDVDLELGPLAALGQFSGVDLLRRANASEGNRAFLAPVGAVVPSADVELEHDRLGQIGRLKVDPDGDHAVGRDVERGAVGEVILGDALGLALEGTLAAMHGTLAGFDEGRGVAGMLDLGLLREGVLEPDRLAGADGRRRGQGGGVDVFERGDGVTDGLLVRGDLGIEVLEALLLFGGRQHQHRRREQDVAVETGVGGAVEERVEGVELLGGHRVELVVVADRAARGEAHPDAHGGLGAVDGVAEEQLFVDRAAFAGGDVATVEAAGDALLAGHVRQEVAGELPGGELIEGQVVVEGLHDPVAVGPHAALVVEVQAVGIGVAGGVEPAAGHVFAVADGTEQALHDAFIGARGGVLEEGVDLGRRGRQAREVEGHATDEALGVGFGAGGQALLRHLGAEEGVDRRGALRGGRDFRTDRDFEAPMLAVDGAFGDPAAKEVDLRRRDLLMRLGRRHDLFRVLAEDALDELARLGVARLHGLDAVIDRGGAFGGVEAEVGLALLGVEAVASEAVVGEDGPDVPVEVQFRVGGREAGGDEQEAEGGGTHGLLGKGGFGGEEGFGVATADLKGADGGEVGVGGRQGLRAGGIDVAGAGQGGGDFLLGFDDLRHEDVLVVAEARVDAEEQDQVRRTEVGAETLQHLRKIGGVDG